MNIVIDSHSALTKSLSLGGPGPRVAIKDCIDIAGEVTSSGSAALRASLPAPDNADVVTALLENGCNIIGKANMHELAFGMTGVNEAFGTPINPHWPKLIPGGSSSGCAVAVASGLSDFAIGTDTGGSVRQPAMCCGVYGLKPTFGRISRKGCTPKESSLDCVGVLARSAAFVTKAMEAIDVSFRKHNFGTKPSFAQFGFEASDHQTQLDQLDLNASAASLDLLEPAFDAAIKIIGAETVSAFGDLVASSSDIGADVVQRIKAAVLISTDDLAEAERIRTAFTKQVDAIFEEADFLITPALALPVPTLHEAKNPVSVLPLTRFLRPFNLSGHPAMTLPMNLGTNERPSGVQIIAAKGADAELCAVAEWLASQHPILTPCFDREEAVIWTPNQHLRLLLKVKSCPTRRIF